MSNKEEPLDLKTLAGYVSAFLIFLSSSRLMIENKKWNLPILNYISSSNLLAYVLHLTYSLNRLILFVLVMMLCRGKIYDIINSQSKEKRKCISVIALIVTGFIWIILGVTYLPNEYLSFEIVQWHAFLLFFGLSIPAILIIVSCPERLTPPNKNILALAMIFIFTWCYVKSAAKYEMWNFEKTRHYQTKILFKDSTNHHPFISNDTNYYLTNITDFVFTYDSSKGQYTAYPMSEVFSISYGDSTKEKKP